MFIRPRKRTGFTITELLVVIAVIGVLLGILLVALGGIWSTGKMTSSMNNLKQISIWMSHYSSDNRDAVLPAYFDNSAADFKGKVRSDEQPQEGGQYTGTWADILTTVYEIAVYPEADVEDSPGTLRNDYRYDSPDKVLYDFMGEGGVSNQLRAASSNTKNTPDGDVARPYGKGALELGYPGFFAANMSFDSAGVVHSGVHTMGEVRAVDRTMYLVDSFAGETIGGDVFDEAFDWENGTCEVDFRYGGDTCLILFLDGHARQQGIWRNLRELQDNHRIKVTDITNN